MRSVNLNTKEVWGWIISNQEIWLYYLNDGGSGMKTEGVYSGKLFSKNIIFRLEKDWSNVTTQPIILAS